MPLKLTKAKIDWDDVVKTHLKKHTSETANQKKLRETALEEAKTMYERVYKLNSKIGRPEMIRCIWIKTLPINNPAIVKWTKNDEDKRKRTLPDWSAEIKLNWNDLHKWQKLALGLWVYSVLKPSELEELVNENEDKKKNNHGDTKLKLPTGAVALKLINNDTKLTLSINNPMLAAKVPNSKQQLAVFDAFDKSRQSTYINHIENNELRRTILTMREHLTTDLYDFLVTYKSYAPNLALSHRLAQDYYVNHSDAMTLFYKAYREHDVTQFYVEEEEMLRCIQALRSVMRGRHFDKFRELPHIISEHHYTFTGNLIDAHSKELIDKQNVPADSIVKMSITAEQCKEIEKHLESVKEKIDFFDSVEGCRALLREMPGAPPVNEPEPSVKPTATKETADQEQGNISSFAPPRHAYFDDEDCLLDITEFESYQASFVMDSNIIAGSYLLGLNSQFQKFAAGNAKVQEPEPVKLQAENKDKPKVGFFARFCGCIKTGKEKKNQAPLEPVKTEIKNLPILPNPKMLGVDAFDIATLSKKAGIVTIESIEQLHKNDAKLAEKLQASASATNIVK